MITQASPAIILVSPKGDLNVGSVARAMENFGATDLRLVDPRCKLDSSDCKQMAMHSYDIIRNAKIFKTLNEAQADLHFSIAFSARDDAGNRPCYFLNDFVEGPWLKTKNSQVAFVFGREESGLKLDELDACDYQVAIPTSAENSSINLAMSVTIALAEIFFSGWKNAEDREKSPSDLEPRPLKIKEELFFSRLQILLDRIRYTNPQNPLHTLDDMKRIFHRAEVSDREMRILFGVLSGIERELQIPSLKDRKDSPRLHLSLRSDN